MSERVSNAPVGTPPDAPTPGIILALGDIFVDEGRNLRRFATDEKHVADLVKSIKANGLIQPVVVEKTPEGATVEVPIPGDAEGKMSVAKPPYTLVAGYNRLKALAEIQAENAAEPVLVPVTVRNGVGPDHNASLAAKLTNLDENIKRKDLTHMDISVAISELRKEGMMDKDIAVRLGKSATFVSETSKFLDLPEKFQKGIHAGVIPYKLGRELIRMTPEEQETAVEAAKKAKEAGENQAEAADSMVNRKKGKRKGKGKKEDKTGGEKNGKSAKAALLEMEQQVAAVKEAGEKDKATENALAVMAMFRKYLNGGMGMKALYTRLAEMF